MNELFLDMSPRATTGGPEVQSIGEIMPAVLAGYGLQDEEFELVVGSAGAELATACCGSTSADC